MISSSHIFSTTLFLLLLSSRIQCLGFGGRGFDFNDILSVLANIQDEDNNNNNENNYVSPRFDRGPPPYDKAARMARYIVHNSNWAAMATRSTRPDIVGFPFANVFSISDGLTTSDSTGIPYMYLTPMEMSVKDLRRDNRASLTMSLAQGSYCDAKHLDPEDPRCAHVILTGQVTKVKPNSTEEAFAKRVLFSRHPEMTQWPKDHTWFFAKLDMVSVLVLDYFGGVKVVTKEQYFDAKPY